MKVNICLEQTRKATGKRSSFTKKRIIISTAIGLLVVVLTIVVSSLSSGKKFKSNNVGREVRIEWEEVNVRKGYSTTDSVITTLRNGSSVTLTGNSYDYLMGNGIATDSWTEIELKDGTTGWVVNASIKWT